jgi:hypothetical protein
MRGFSWRKWELFPTKHRYRRLLKELINNSVEPSYIFVAKIHTYIPIQGCVSGSAWIRIIFGGWLWILIRICVKGRFRIQKSKIQELKRLRMELLRAMDAQNGGVYPHFKYR